jgi:hypothetical protein
MKKRLLLVLTLGVSFSPAVFAEQNVMSATNSSGVVCDADQARDKINNLPRTVVKPASNSRNGKTLESVGLDKS